MLQFRMLIEIIVIIISIVFMSKNKSRSLDNISEGSKLLYCTYTVNV